MRHGTVPGFDGILGQSLPIRILQTLINQASVPHALLFTGKPGIGKTTTAQAFAAALNCDQTPGAHHPEDQSPNPPVPCGMCASCRRIAAGNHPDVIVVAPQGAYLRIEQIRNLRTALAMKPFNARQRVVIITDSHCMNPEAGNALLKMLEEPPEDTVLVLTALQRSGLLPTIVSRCRHIRFNPIPTDDIKRFLVVTQGLDEAQAEQAAVFADGSLGEALQLKQRSCFEERDWLIRSAGLDHPDALARRPVAAAIAFAAQLAGHKDRIEEFLGILKTWVRDIGMVAVNPETVVNRDQRNALEAIGRHVDAQTVLEWWDIIGKAQKAIAGNANLRLTLDVMALALCCRHPQAGSERLPQLTK